MLQFLVALFSRFVHGAPKTESVRDDYQIPEMAEAVKEAAVKEAALEPRPVEPKGYTVKKLHKRIMTGSVIRY